MCICCSILASFLQRRQRLLEIHSLTRGRMKSSLLSHDVLSGFHVIAVDFRVAASCAGFASVASDLRNLSCNPTDTAKLMKFNQCTYLRSPTSSARFLLLFVSNSRPHKHLPSPNPVNSQVSCASSETRSSTFRISARLTEGEKATAVW